MEAAGWVAAGVAGCVSLSLLLAALVSGDMAVLAQGAVVTMAAGTVDFGVNIVDGTAGADVIGAGRMAR